MANLIAPILFVLGILGVIVIILRKMPVLVSLPENQKNPRADLVELTKSKLGNFPFIKSFSYDFFLQKILSKLRVLILKSENVISLWLSQLRERSSKRTENFQGGYWKKLKGIRKKSDRI